MRGKECATRHALSRLVGLKDSINRRPHQLSGGMKHGSGSPAARRPIPR